MRLLHIASLMLLCFSLFSCSSSKGSLTYFEDLMTVDSVTMAAGKYNIRIVPDDKLLITVQSSTPEAAALYNSATPNYSSLSSVPSLPTYIVNSRGDIKFPELGEIHVAGLTTSEISEKISGLVSKYIRDPRVDVQLINFRVSVIGEVNTPREIDVDRERFSVIDALAAAGDLTPYGDREHIKLIRETDGKREVHTLNINSSELLSSPYFYLKQNDVLVIQPNDVRQDNSKVNQNNSYKLQVLSTLVGTASIIASLIIALTVK